MISAILFTMLFLPVHWDLIQNYNCTFVNQGTYADVTLTWDLPLGPAEQIAIFRGNMFKGWLGGNSTTVTFKEASFGAFQYTIAWLWQGRIYDYDTGVLNLGRVTWDKPSTAEPTGYYLYVLEEQTLPEVPIPHDVDTFEIDPQNPHMVFEVPLLYMLDKGLFPQNETRYIAAAAYYATLFFDIDGKNMISVSGLVPAEGGLAFVYKDVTWPNLPEIPGVPEQPVMQW